MSNGFVQVPPDSTGKQVATYELAGKQYQIVGLADSTGAEITPLTDTQLRATPVAVSGTVTANTGLTQPLTDAQLRATAVTVADGGGSLTVDNASLTSLDSKIPASLVDLPSQDQSSLPVRQAPQKLWGWSFARAITNGVDTTRATLLQAGTGMTVNQTGGNLVITSGTTANSETIIRSLEAWNGDISLLAAVTLSQRIANNNFFVELVDLIGDGLTYSIVNATTVDVTQTAHGFTAQNVGQRIDIQAITGAAGVPQAGVIASIPDANTIRFTVSGWPASGTGTCSLTGWNKIEVLYTGTTATNVSFNTRRQGYENTAVAATINTTASGHLVSINKTDSQCSLADQVATSAGVLANRNTWRTNLPEKDIELYLQIKVRNGTVAPASTTTFTLGMLRVEDYIAQQVEITATRQQGAYNSLPVSGAVTVSGTVTANIGTGALAAGTNAIGDVGTQYRANATGAASISNFVALGTTNPTVIKAGAGRLLGYHLTNNATAVRYVKFHNSSTAPTAGTGVVATIGIPPNGGSVFMNLPGGIAFTTGIALTTVTGPLANDTTAVAANDIVGTFIWA